MIRFFSITISFFIAITLFSGGALAEEKIAKEKAEATIKEKAPEKTSEKAEPLKKETFKYEAQLLGINIEVILFATSPDEAAAISTSLFEEMKKIEKLMAVQKEGSELSKLNAEAGDNTIALSADTLQLLTKGLELSEKTQGAWTLTSGSLSKLWLFEKGANPPDPDTIAKKLKLVDDEKLNLDSKKSTGLLKKEGMVIDATEIVRGFAIEKARAHLLAKGVSDALIIAGGDIRTIGKKGDKSWVIGIQDPNAEGYFAILESSDEAIATSGDYSHFFIKDEVRYHSVLDPRSGQPARGVQSVTVISKDSMVSAAYSRAIFVLGTIEGIKLAEAEPDLEVVIVDDKNEVILSSGLRDRLRLARPITKD